jgi:hypothetical protein
LASYGVGSTSSDIHGQEVTTEAEYADGRLENEKETKITEKTNERLRDLAPNDELYEAMENFLLGDPKNQIPQLGDPAEILGKEDSTASKGEDLIARAQYETLAKVAIYKQEPELVKKSLDEAAKATNPADRHARMQKTIQNNMDEVLRIAREYYETKEAVTAETNAEVAAEASKNKKE